MSKQQHTKECKRLNKQARKQTIAYDNQYPNHCHTCNGYGGFWSRYDPSPSGVSLSSGSMEEFDVCPDCVKKGKCPRCGQVLVPKENGDIPDTCSHCQFDFNKPIGRPQDYVGCDCDIDEEEY